MHPLFFSRHSSRTVIVSPMLRLVGSDGISRPHIGVFPTLRGPIRRQALLPRRQVRLGWRTQALEKIRYGIRSLQVRGDEGRRTRLRVFGTASPPSVRATLSGPFLFVLASSSSVRRSVTCGICHLQYGRSAVRFPWENPSR